VTNETNGRDDSDTKILFLSKTSEILEAIKAAQLNSCELARLEGEIMKIRGERVTGTHKKVKETKKEAS
jgi:hypothetical protein